MLFAVLELNLHGHRLLILHGLLVREKNSLEVLHFCVGEPVLVWDQTEVLLQVQLVEDASGLLVRVSDDANWNKFLFLGVSTRLSFHFLGRL